MNIDRDAPVITRDEIVIESPLDTVWTILTNIDRWSDWNSGIQSAMLESDLAVGAVFRWETSGMEIASTVGELVPQERIAWSGLAQGIMGIHIWQLTTVENGILVQTEESWEGKPVRVQINLMKNVLDQSIRAWLESLKTAAESIA